MRPTVYRVPPTFFRATATVYTGDGWNTVYQTGVPCRLEAVQSQEATSGGQRAELAAARSLYYHPNYAIPNNARIKIDGRPERYQVRANSQTPYPEDSATPAWWQCDVVRV